MKVEPRWLDAAATADYISVRPDTLPRLVKAGRLPSPAYPLGPRQPRWDRLALDSVFAGSTASTNAEQVMAAVANEIRSRR